MVWNDERRHSNERCISAFLIFLPIYINKAQINCQCQTSAYQIDKRAPPSPECAGQVIRSMVSALEVNFQTGMNPRERTAAETVRLPIQGCSLRCTQSGPSFPISPPAAANRRIREETRGCWEMLGVNSDLFSWCLSLFNPPHTLLFHPSQ